MKGKWFTVSALSLLSLVFDKAYSHSPICDVLMNPPDEINAFGDSALDETDRLIAYLESLLKERVIVESHLSSFISELEKDRVLNPLQGLEGSAAAIQGAGIQEYIDRGELDKDRLLKWAEQKLVDGRRARVSRDETQEETRYPHQEMVFHPVRVGSFQMGSEENKVVVHLTYPIEVMATQVTQWQWVEVMGENPSYHKRGEFSAAITRGGKSILMQPDYPVESVTWWSALVFANRLSKKHGLQPVYNLTDITWKSGTRAEDGSLLGIAGEIRINTGEGIYDLSSGDTYYQAIGYRLPTEAEQEYLLRAGGTENGRYHFGDDATRLKDYAWYRDNSENQTHPVAFLKPLILDGKGFYDLHGNVGELSWDCYSHRASVDNPVGLIGSALVARGGSWICSDSDSSIAARTVLDSGGARDSVGFRLVRTIKSPEGISAQ